MYRILMVEDDATIVEVVASSLRRWNYEVQTVKEFSEVMDDFRRFQPHLVVLDVTLPQYNGYHWCREIRAISKVPVLFLSSAAENMNLIMAMELGADDYMTKPFDLPVLEAKIRALLRRTYDFGEGVEWLEYGGVSLHPERMEARYGEQQTSLTKNECRILEALLRMQGQVMSRERLMNALWQSDVYVDDNTLSVNIARLRKTLANIGAEGLIETKKGVGYYVRSPES